MRTIIEAGPALVLQELGNLGTILIAFPLAVWVLGMGREVIGAAHSVAREPNIAIISDRYGLNTPEGTGIMGVYVVGTLFGTIIFALLASLFGSILTWFHPYALAMACGIGSGSMMASCSGTLASFYPEMEERILALAGASNLLTYADGLYMSLFVALPICEFLYRRLGGREEPSTAPTTEEGAE
jgi:MFS family permease